MLLGKTALENLFSKVFTILNSFIFPHEDRELKFSYFLHLNNYDNTSRASPEIHVPYKLKLYESSKKIN